ncbi:heavy-metal-associated domain-containing protein [Clostridium sardiniense]|uniref:heavy-metal-associated domain-containing protein n=1 Tax=Clostridium sardiniense TaxID=29369 RepID=UPI00195AA372|nr:heavy-metal-associated domain-containing protein [Clostridium sardiniense]MBM7835822.1 copper chaperone CopZ [Clostridium sardiniense]
MTKYKIKIDGMGCQKCVDNVERAFAGDGRVKQYEVKVGEAIVECDLTKEELKDLIDDAGYDLETVEEIEKM